jgi:protein HIRA/HIR1
MYAKRIGAEGLKTKVEELLKGLLGGLFEEDDDEPDSTSTNKTKDKSDRNWKENSETLCGWPREVLLKEVILALGKLIHLRNYLVC